MLKLSSFILDLQSYPKSTTDIIAFKEFFEKATIKYKEIKWNFFYTKGCKKENTHTGYHSDTANLFNVPIRLCIYRLVPRELMETNTLR